MSDLLKELLGKMVEVRSLSGNGGGYDKGKLADYDERWVKLDKAVKECFISPLPTFGL